MKIDFLKISGLLELGTLCRRRIPGVVETGVVFEPGINALTVRCKCVRQQFAGCDIHHVPFRAVTACDRDAIRPQFAVVGESRTVQGSRAVGKDLVRVEKNSARIVDRCRLVKNALVLQTVVLCIDIKVVGDLGRRRVTLVVGKLGQPGFEFFTLWNGREI